MPLSPTAQRWADLVSALEQSNLTAKAFAVQHNVNVSTLSWWRSRLRVASTSRAFVAVDVPAAVAPRAPGRPLQLEFTDRAVALSIPEDVDLAWLRAVVDALS